MLARLVDARPGLVRAWLVLGPSIVGFYPLTGLINPFWGSLSGWPLYLVARTHPVPGPHPAMEMLVFFGSPLAVVIARAWLAGRLIAWSGRWRSALVALWAASAFAVVPFSSLADQFSGWPVWCACE